MNEQHSKHTWRTLFGSERTMHYTQNTSMIIADDDGDSRNTNFLYDNTQTTEGGWLTILIEPVRLKRTKHIPKLTKQEINQQWQRIHILYTHTYTDSEKSAQR